MNTTPRRPAMAPTPEAGKRSLREELTALADALVDARPSDRRTLRERAGRVEDACRRTGGRDDVARLLSHIVADLSSDADAIDTLYHARQLVVVAERVAH